MSANNYTLVYPIGDTWCVWLSLNAEEAIKNPTLSIDNAAEVFDQKEKAIAWAVENEESEYGVTTTPYKPKDGFPEKIITHLAREGSLRQEIEKTIEKTIKTEYPKNIAFIATDKLLNTIKRRLPKEMGERARYNIYGSGYEDGYNACLKEVIELFNKEVENG